jgi:ribosome-dependent ATPase
MARRWGGTTLEAAFIECLEAANATTRPPSSNTTLPASPAPASIPRPRSAFSVNRLWAYAGRETLELLRDPIRLSFATLGMAFLMTVLGFGMNTDVDHVSFAVYDQDQSNESRAYIEAFSGSSYFLQSAPILTDAALVSRLEAGSVEMTLDIPAGFGRDVRRGRRAQASAWIDGAMPFLAQTIEGYVQGVQEAYVASLPAQTTQTAAPVAVVVPRYVYNQAFESIKSLVPSAMSLELALIPAILMALAVVREKEFGSITNLFVTPVTRLEFAIGKQLPYVALAMTSFVMLVLIATFLFHVPVKGSFAALAAGTLVYVTATTAYGLLISAFAKTQIAALFGTAILTFLPATQFAGMMSPVSSLTGAGAVIGRLFPMSYYLPIAIGTFDKSLGFAELTRNILILALFVPGLIGLSVWLLPKQER